MIAFCRNSSFRLKTTKTEISSQGDKGKTAIAIISNISRPQNSLLPGPAMKSVTSSKLQNNLDQLLDEILNTGKPQEIERNGKRLIISPVETVDKLQKLIYRPQAIIGDPDDLVQISWKRQILIYLDTHIVVWLYAGLTAKLSDCAKHLINENELYISPIVRLELQYLYEIGRITEKSDDIVL